MRTRLLAPLAAALLLSTAGVQTAAAQNVLYWSDFSVGTNVLDMLQSIRPGLTFTSASDQTDFNTQLGSGSFDLAIVGEQDGTFFGSSETALTSYLASGGRIIGSSWQSSPMAGFFGATFESSNNQTITGSGALFTGLLSPISVANPGWSTFSQGYTATAGTCLATFEDASCAAVLGNGGRTLLYGPLFDSYADANVGAQFVANGADLLLGAADPTVVPEPATMALLGTGLMALGFVGVRRRRREMTA